jgi:hypothetical protein
MHNHSLSIKKFEKVILTNLYGPVDPIGTLSLVRPLHVKI